LKLENLLLATPQDIRKVKIADFGLAKKAQESQMETICGTPQYVAPEVIQVGSSQTEAPPHKPGTF
jgi:calcium/calmodulin-dependent protein kinase I